MAEGGGELSAQTAAEPAAPGHAHWPAASPRRSWSSATAAPDNPSSTLNSTLETWGRVSGCS